MRASRLVAFSCFIAAGCKAETSGGPTTSHRLAGTWSYDMPVLQDGHGLNCSIMGPVLTLTQSGVTFAGSVKGGVERCTWPGGGHDSGAMSPAPVLAGAILGDTVSFDVLNSLWHNVGQFVTVDSMTGVVNSIYSIGGQQYYIAGLWYSRRTP